MAIDRRQVRAARSWNPPGPAPREYLAYISPQEARMIDTGPPGPTHNVSGGHVISQRRTKMPNVLQWLSQRPQRSASSNQAGFRTGMRNWIGDRPFGGAGSMPPSGGGGGGDLHPGAFAFPGGAEGGFPGDFPFPGGAGRDMSGGSGGGGGSDIHPGPFPFPGGREGGFPGSFPFPGGAGRDMSGGGGGPPTGTRSFPGQGSGVESGFPGGREGGFPGGGGGRGIPSFSIGGAQAYGGNTGQGAGSAYSGASNQQTSASMNTPSGYATTGSGTGSNTGGGTGIGGYQQAQGYNTGTGAPVHAYDRSAGKWVTIGINTARNNSYRYSATGPGGTAYGAPSAAPSSSSSQQRESGYPPAAGTVMDPNAYPPGDWYGMMRQGTWASARPGDIRVNSRGYTVQKQANGNWAIIGGRTGQRYAHQGAMPSAATTNPFGVPNPRVAPTGTPSAPRLGTTGTGSPGFYNQPGGMSSGPSASFYSGYTPSVGQVIGGMSPYSNNSPAFQSGLDPGTTSGTMRSTAPFGPANKPSWGFR